jgi:hypothetical protein
MMRAAGAKHEEGIAMDGKKGSAAPMEERERIYL